ncbi:MAG: hypothetical protein AAFR38_13910 [Planctomycetota bacterium]
MQRRAAAAVLIASFVTLSAAIAVRATSQPSALGPLDPPAGPVADTSPDLAEIRAQLDAIQSQQVTTAMSNGPWEVEIVELGISDQDLSVPIVPGRNLVHAVVVYRGFVQVFDGPGRVDNVGFPANGRMIGLAEQFAANSGGGFGEGSTHSEINVVAENGVQLAWAGFNSSSIVALYYRPLPPAQQTTAATAK